MADPANTGIYEIVNLVNGKRYIGSAAKLDVRWRLHRLHLRRGTHHSKHLQASWQKNGEPNFEFRVIEICPKEVLIEREQAAFERLKPEFNIAPRAGSCLGVRHSEETKAKISAAKMGNQAFLGRKHSEETLALMSAAKSGKPSHLRGRLRCRDAVEKTAAAHRGTKRSPETGARISKALAGKKRLPRTDEHRANLSAAQRGKPKSPESIEKMRATKRGKTLTEDHKAKIGAGSREAWRRLKESRAHAQSSLFTSLDQSG